MSNQITLSNFVLSIQPHSERNGPRIAKNRTPRSTTRCSAPPPPLPPPAATSYSKHTNKPNCHTQRNRKSQNHRPLHILPATQKRYANNKTNAKLHYKRKKYSLHNENCLNHSDHAIYEQLNQQLITEYCCRVRN